MDDDDMEEGEQEEEGAEWLNNAIAFDLNESDEEGASKKKKKKKEAPKEVDMDEEMVDE